MWFLGTLKKRETSDKKNAEFKFIHNIENFIKFNDKTKKILVPSTQGNEFLNYSDVKDFELIEKINTTTIKKGGLDKSVARGTLLGTTDAIIGGITGNQVSNQICTLMKINIITSDFYRPTIPIYLSTTKEKIDSPNYKAHIALANKILVILEILARRNSDKNSSITEILKLKELLENGILTQEEFYSEKTKVLNR